MGQIAVHARLVTLCPFIVLSVYLLFPIARM
jgi:hypothetical protein